MRARVTRGEPLSNESADSLVKYSLSVIWMRVSSTVKRHNSIHRDPLTIHLPARSPIVIFLVPSNYPRAHPPPPPRAPALCKTGENGLSLRPGKSVNRVDRGRGRIEVSLVTLCDLRHATFKHSITRNPSLNRSPFSISFSPRPFDGSRWGIESCLESSLQPLLPRRGWPSPLFAGDDRQSSDKTETIFDRARYSTDLFYIRG